MDRNHYIYYILSLETGILTNLVIMNKVEGAPYQYHNKSKNKVFEYERWRSYKEALQEGVGLFNAKQSYIRTYV